MRLERDVATELEPAAALYLFANNRDARLRYVEIAARHLGDAIGDLPANAPVFWVTLINREHAVREDEAGAFQIKRLHRWAHRLLRGCNYVGMVEAALFTNLDVVAAGYKRTVSWHCHLHVWGVSEEVIAEICTKANTRYRTLVPGVTVAHYRPVTYAEACERAFYMHKGQISEYRVWQRRRVSMDDDTGVITIVGTGRFSQGKRPMRPGDMARMCRVFAGRTLDRLAFAGGAGRKVLDAIRVEALGPRREQDHREAARRASQEALRHAHRSAAARKLIPHRLGSRR